MVTLPGQPPCPTHLIHHIGIAVHNLESAIQVYRDLFGLKPGPILEHAEIGVRGCFIPVGDSNLEVLEATRPDSAVARFLEKRGEGLHHVCFEVEEIAQGLKNLQGRGVRLVDQEPRPGLTGWPVAFLHPSSANGVLIELAQHG